MPSNLLVLRSVSVLLFLLSTLMADLSFARGFGAGIGHSDGNINAIESGRNFQNHPAISPYTNPGTNHYHPGYGWGNSAVIIANPVPLYNSNCQTVQQCTADGGCIQTNQCE